MYWPLFGATISQVLVKHDKIIKRINKFVIPEEIRKTWGAFKFYSMLIIAFAAAVYIAFTYGNQHFEIQQADIEKLEHTMENLSVENQNLNRQLNILGVELEVQRLAAQKSQVEIQSGLEREALLKKDIQFYQKVMAPELKEGGFLIEAFDVTKSLSDQAYRYEIVLLQQDKIKSMVNGNISVTLIGSENGQPKQYNLKSMITETSSPLKFSFKYFQRINGEMILPEGFLVEKVAVKAQVFQFKRRRGELERVFDWQIESNTSLAE